MKTLVVVESPTKAKKIGQYLGKDYIVKSSVGHIRDLPIPSKVPATKKANYGKFAIDIENDFDPLYQVYPDKKKVVTELKTALKECDELLLATDEDREGEAIAWHLLEVLNPKVPVKRMVFHEITKSAIEEALKHTRELDYNLIDAQETRRIVDRLFGYELSPILWRKFGPGLSAGRVQSVAVRLIVERERERLKFKKADFSSLTATLSTIGTSAEKFPAKLVEFGSKRVAVSKDFTEDGVLSSRAETDGVVILTPKTAEELNLALKTKTAELTVASVNKKPYTRSPKAPFTTSTLQIEAGNRLHMSSAQVMRVAQQLYENGYITYMRTDSPALSAEALTAARNSATAMFGKDAVLPQPKQYSTKSASAQEAHEAIRPAGSSFASPDQLATSLDGQQLALYDLIWRRTIASQMVNAEGFQTTVKILAEVKGEKPTSAMFQIGGITITKKGFLQALEDVEVDPQDASSDDEAKAAEKSVRLPDLSEGEALDYLDAEIREHQTKPPARFTEPTLVREMEKLGIGRPSTYASTIQTIQDRNYVYKKGAALVPRWLAFAVVGLLESQLTKYVDYQFTANMEEDLDKIAASELNKLDWMKKFYFGASSKAGTDGNSGLRHDVQAVIDAHKKEQFTDDVFELQSDNFQVHLYRSSAYVEPVGPAVDGEIKPKGRIPDDLPPDELTDEVAADLVEAGKKADEPLGVNPATGYPIVVKTGKYGPFFSEVLPEGVPTKGKGAVKPKMASLLKTWDPTSVTLEQALKVMQLPLSLGINPPDGEEIKVNNGMFGPYLVKKDLATGKPDYRSIKKTETETAEERMFTITLDEAIEVYSQPKVYRGRRRKK